MAGGFPRLSGNVPVPSGGSPVPFWEKVAYAKEQEQNTARFSLSDDSYSPCPRGSPEKRRVLSLISVFQSELIYAPFDGLTSSLKSVCSRYGSAPMAFLSAFISSDAMSLKPARRYGDRVEVHRLWNVLLHFETKGMAGPGPPRKNPLLNTPFAVIYRACGWVISRPR